MTNPFLTWTPEQIQGLPEVADPVRDWEQLHAGSPYISARHVMDTGSKLAGEVRRLRAMVAALEAETACRWAKHHTPDLVSLDKRNYVACDECGNIRDLDPKASQ